MCRAGVSLQLLEQISAGAEGEPNVEHDRCGLEIPHEGRGSERRVGGCDFIASSREDVHQQPAYKWIVLDNQDLFHCVPAPGGVVAPRFLSWSSRTVRTRNRAGTSK